MNRSRVLVADNHESVREVMSNLLDLLNVDAIPCRGGDEVLARVETEEVDGVISDVMMPEMGGLDLVERLKVRRPKIPVIMMSSYFSEALEEEVRSKGAVGIVAKPFKVEAVTRLLKEAGIKFLMPA